MRTLFGVVLGIALTVGAAFFHDNNVSPNPASADLTNRQIVNWDVLNAVTHDTTEYFTQLWDRVINRKS